MPKSISASLRMILQKMGPSKLMKRDFTMEEIRGAADSLSHEQRGVGRSWGTKARPIIDMKANPKR